MIPSLSPSALIEQFEGEFVVHLPDTKKTYLADPIMAFLLFHCDGKNSIARITDMLIEQYPAQSEKVSEDIPQVVKEMLDAGIITL